MNKIINHQVLLKTKPLFRYALSQQSKFSTDTTTTTITLTGGTQSGAGWINIFQQA